MKSKIQVRQVGRAAPGEPKVWGCFDSAGLLKASFIIRANALAYAKIENQLGKGILLADGSDFSNKNCHFLSQ